MNVVVAEKQREICRELKNLVAKIEDGIKEIPIEERSEIEVSNIQGKDETGYTTKVKVTPEGTLGANPAFDVTPARLITGLITEKGVCQASAEGLSILFPNLARGVK